MNKVWFITGASRGLGAEIARAAIDAGYDVVATARESSAVERALGNSAHLMPVPLDVTRRGGPEQAVKAAVARFGRIDVLVNNAGCALIGAVEECTDEEVRRQLDTNLLGLLAVTRAALPTLRAQRKGHIFNVSSVAGFRGDPGGSSYSASKFAVEGLSESLASEPAPLGIRVTIVEPGYFRTEFLTNGSAHFAAHVLQDYDITAGHVRRLMKEYDGKQANDPRKLARALVTLAFRAPSAAILRRRGRGQLVRRTVCVQARRARSLACSLSLPRFRGVKPLPSSTQRDPLTSEPGR
jgi:NAD(P)-dependent dehydrogenase (short-subunit alcohol dehydrogenase family)